MQYMSDMFPSLDIQSVVQKGSSGKVYAWICFTIQRYEFCRRVAGTMVARSSSVRVIARSNLSLCTCMWGSDWPHIGHQEFGRCSIRGGSQGMYVMYTSAMWIRQSPFWLWNPEETSSEIQNRGTSGPKKGKVSAKNCFLRPWKMFKFIFHTLHILQLLSMT